MLAEVAGVVPFSTLRESRGCETRYTRIHAGPVYDFQYSPRVEGV